jgi:hypothetical protein
VRAAIVLCALAATSPAFAQTEAIQRAKELFKRGVEHYQNGDLDKALQTFLESRAAYRSSKNTLNAALCLERLGRYDEALEMYEQVMVFWAELDDADRKAIETAMATLKTKVVQIEVTANVEGDLYVDGRFRANMPLRRPLRVRLGKRVLRITKAGHRPFETTLEVTADGAPSVTAVLLPDKIPEPCPPGMFRTGAFCLARVPEARTSPVPDEPPEPKKKSSPWPWVMLTGGLVGVGGVLSTAYSEDRRPGIALVVIGGSTMVLGLIAYLQEYDGPTKQHRVRLIPTVGPGYAGLSFSSRL